MVCNVCVFYDIRDTRILINFSFSCDADPTDLDNPAAELRTREQLLTLLETEDDDALWFGYGIVPDFLVGCTATMSNEH
jgi:hypothetical protein